MRTGGFHSSVTLGLAIPPNPPADVEQAHDKLVALAERVADLKAEIRTAESKIVEARAADIVHVADEAAEGRMVDNPNAREQKATRNVEKSRAPQAGIELAVDRAGDHLLAVIHAHRDQWTAAQHDQLAAAHGEYQHAVAAALTAATKMRSARAAIRWLRDEIDPTGPDPITGYSGEDDLEVDSQHRPSPNERLKADVLLQAAAALTAEPLPPPAPRNLVAARPDNARDPIRPRRATTPVAA